MFSLMFAFSLYLTQNTNIIVQSVLNPQKNWSGKVFWKKNCISDGNRNFPYKTLKIDASSFSLMFACFSFLAQNTNIIFQPVLNLPKNWSK